MSYQAQISLDTIANNSRFSVDILALHCYHHVVRFDSLQKSRQVSFFFCFQTGFSTWSVDCARRKSTKTTRHWLPFCRIADSLLIQELLGQTILFRVFCHWLICITQAKTRFADTLFGGFRVCSDVLVEAAMFLFRACVASANSLKRQRQCGRSSNKYACRFRVCILLLQEDFRQWLLLRQGSHTVQKWFL